MYILCDNVLRLVRMRNLYLMRRCLYLEHVAKITLVLFAGFQSNP
jgi:hypothetical protein